MAESVNVQPYQVEPEKKNRLAQNAQTYLEAAQAFAIETEIDFELADDLLVKGQQRKKEVEEVFGPLVKKAHETHKAIKAQENEAVKPIDEGRKLLKSKMAAWQQEQERKRRAERERLERERREKEEAEHQRLEEERLKEAAELEAQGKGEEAEAVLNAPVDVDPGPVAPVAPPAPKTKTVFRKHYTFEIDDAGKIPREYMTPDEKMIGGIVRAMGKAAEKKIPGIKVQETKV